MNDANMSQSMSLELDLLHLRIFLCEQYLCVSRQHCFTGIATWSMPNVKMERGATTPPLGKCTNGKSQMSIEPPEIASQKFQSYPARPAVSVPDCGGFNHCYIYNVYTVFMYRGYVLNDLNGFNDSAFTITFIRNRNYRRCIMMHPWAISDIQGLTRAVLHSGPSGTLSSCIATWSDIGSCQAQDRGYWELNPHFGDTFQTLTISNHGWGQETYVFMCFDYVFIDHCVLDCYSYRL